MEYNCEHRPLEMIMICSSELYWVMSDVLNYMSVIVVDLKICILTYCVNDLENGIMHFHMHCVT